MKIHTPAELRHVQADETFRMPPWGALLFPALLLAACVLLVGLWWNGHLPEAFWLWPCCVGLALFALFALYVNFIPTLNPASNWVLKVKGDRLYLMLRNYCNTHLPDDAPVIVSFETSEIESIGQQEKRISVPDTHGGTRSWKERRLEIRLRDKAPQEFITTLNAQPEWSGTGWIRKKNDPSPVSYDERTIRIMWSGLSVGIVPRIDRALVILGRTVPIHDKSVVDRSQWAHLTDSQLDDHILELCQAGNHMEAIKLLRERRNYSFTEAKRFVDEISGRQRGPG